MSSTEAQRMLTYVYLLQDPNQVGVETEIARVIERDAGGTMGGSRSITFGGTADIPLLQTGRYRVKLVVSYQFLPRPLSADTKLVVQSQTNLGIVTLFNNIPPADNTEIVVEENFACFDYFACHQINNVTVDFRPNGDFLVGDITPVGNYEILWAQSPTGGFGTPAAYLPTNPDNSTRALCTNTTYRLRVIDRSNGCGVDQFFPYNGVFDPDVTLARTFCSGTDALNCLVHHSDSYCRRESIIGNDVDRVRTVTRDYDDGSNEDIWSFPFRDPLDPFLTFIKPAKHQYPVGVQTCYTGWYTMVSTNGCVSDIRFETVCLPDPVCSGPPPEDEILETTISPNPVSGTLNIKLKTGSNLASLEIINIAGQILYNEKCHEETTKDVDMSRFSSGIYFVRLKNTEGVQKMVKVVKN